MDIARFLEGGPRRRFIAAFRGVGKTFLTAAYIVWRLWRNPDMKILVVSANETFAAKVAGFVHAIINGEDNQTRELVPWAILRAKQGQRNSVLSFDVGPARPDKDPSVFALGIGGQLPGTRADLILSDDVEVPNNSETESMRERLETRTGEYAAVLKPGGEVIYLGTFQSMQSIYRNLRAKGYAMRLWPARYPTKEKLHLYEDTLAPMLREDMLTRPELMEKTSSTLGGHPTDPERFHEADLMEREAEWGLAGFQLQFMLDTSLTDAERFPLKTRDLIVMDTNLEVAPVRVAWGSGSDQAIKDLDNLGFDGDRLHRPVYKSTEWVPYTGSLMEIDPSGSGSDETAYAVTKFLNGMIFIRKWGGFRNGHSEETLASLAQIAKDEKVNLIRVESNFGDGMFSRLLEPHLRKVKYSTAIVDHKVTGQKEVRIMNTIRSVLQQHRLVIDTEVARTDIESAKKALLTGQGTRQVSNMETSGLYQLTHLTEARGSLRKDDRIDVLSNAIGYWAEYLNADAEEAERKREEAETAEFERLLWSTSVTRSRQRPRPQRGRGRRR